jgi:outer membrane protein OmpA-like peptidoglycan-associated protein
VGPAGEPGPAGPKGDDAYWLSFKDVLFDYDKWDIHPSERTKINELVEFLRRNPLLTVNLEGHTDPRGAGAYNQRLSQRRVNAVLEAVKAAGVDQRRVLINAFGERRRKCNEQTDDCFRRDRRVEIWLRAGTGQ